MSSNSRTTLHQLLQQRNSHPEQAAAIDQEINQIFAQTCAIFVLDMSGFSRLTLRYGIIHFLAMIQRMCSIATPIVNQQGGRVFKQEADNLFAVFPAVSPAMESAVAIFREFALINQQLPDNADLHAGIGIGYGSLLVVDEEDVYGCEMNLACKLGEDLARRGEILLTEAAFQQVEWEPREWEHLDLSTSGLELKAHKLVFSR